MYRQHNSPEQFQHYFADTVEKFISSGKTLCLMGDIDIDLLKSTHCQYAHDFLSSLLSCYLIPTIDKPTRVHRSSATLISEFGVPAVNLKIACDWERVGIKIHFYMISRYEISKFEDLAGI